MTVAAPDLAGWVMIVDDDASVRRSLARLFRQTEYGVETFASAEDFLAHKPRRGPVCLVLDVHMPGVDGLQLQQRLAATQLPIIFITGAGDVPMSVRAIKAGAVDFLLKPVADDVLIQAVGTALRRSQHQLALREKLADTEQRFLNLTRRERDVFRLVVTGRPNKLIAAELGIVEQTVKVHRGRVMRKLQADSVAQLVQISARLETKDQGGAC